MAEAKKKKRRKEEKYFSSWVFTGKKRYNPNKKGMNGTRNLFCPCWHVCGPRSVEMPLILVDWCSAPCDMEKRGKRRRKKNWTGTNMTKSQEQMMMTQASSGSRTLNGVVCLMHLYFFPSSSSVITRSERRYVPAELACTKAKFLPQEGLRGVQKGPTSGSPAIYSRYTHHGHDI